MAELDTSLLESDDSASIPRTRLSEIGYVGLKTSAGRILEESNYKLRFPYFVNEVKEMLNDATIATGMDFVRTMISRVEWRVEPPMGATDEQKEKAKFINTCMHDMEHTWQKFITTASNYIPYGFQVHEKVYRRRLKTAGSKFNDGLIGWRSLPVRSQSTISEWVYSDDGRKLLGVEQSTANMPNVKTVESDIFLPREKILLFTAGGNLETPEGSSPLKAVWKHWRYRQEIEKLEAVGVSR